jgi:hypothetical protein
MKIYILFFFIYGKDEHHSHRMSHLMIQIINLGKQADIIENENITEKKKKLNQMFI